MGGLSASEIEFYEEQGYLGPFRAWDENEVDSYRSWLDKHLFPAPESDGAKSSSQSFKDRHLESQTVMKIASHPEIVERMASLMGGDLMVWTTRFFIKPPGGPAFPWHQDQNYMQGALDPCVNVTAWMALNVVDEENGCVQVLPGTHRDTVAHRSIGTKAFQGGLGEEAAVDREVLERAVSIPLRPGEFFLFNENTIHGSDANRSNRPRYGLAIRVCPATVKLNIGREGYAPVLLRGTAPDGSNAISPGSIAGD